MESVIRFLSVLETFSPYLTPSQTTLIFLFLRLHRLQNIHNIELGRGWRYILGGVYMRKLAPARVSTWDDFLISYRVYMMTGPFHILLFNGTFHVDKIHVWFKIANITHVLPVPVYRQTDFTPKSVVVSRLHDTVARFRTGVNSLQGESRPGVM